MKTSREWFGAYKASIIIVIVVVMSIVLISCNAEDESVEDKVSKISLMNDDVANDEYQDYDERTIELIESANSGDVDAMNTLAYYYFNGYHVEQNYQKSLDWSIQSAEGGNLASMFNVGYNYYYGYAGEVNYDLSFEWYKRAANEMFPKALNALGHMYYEGLGVEKNVDKATEYTFQSAGFLHNYSLSNMGSLIDDESLGGDCNFWYRLAAKNYMFQSATNTLLHDKLVNGEVSIEVNQSLKGEAVPHELIQDILFRYYSGTLYEYLEESSTVFKDFDINDLKMDEKTLQLISPDRWYDSYYLIDVNNDNKNELVCFRLDGTMGISSLRILTLENDKYVLNEALSNTSLMHGINGFVTFKDKQYFVVANINIDNKSIFGVSVYSFDNCKLSDSVIVKVEEQSVDYIKTFQLSDYYNELNEAVEARINKMFVKKYNSILYEHVNETLTVDVDIDNDGVSEHYEYGSLPWGTINRSISLEFRSGLSSEDDMSVISKVLDFNDLATPLGLEFFTIDDVNFVSLLGYELGTNNYCFTTFKIDGEQVSVIINHLITCDEIFIISDDNQFFHFE